MPSNRRFVCGKESASFVYECDCGEGTADTWDRQSLTWPLRV